jgi:uncharacterized protein
VGEVAVEDNLREADQRAQPTGPPAGPVTEPERAVTLDAIRGLAIVGVLAANTVTFAYPMWDANSAMAAVRDASLADRVTMALLGLFVQGKFYMLLSVLFGAGLVLQGRRVEAGGQPATLILVRRCLTLLVIGLIHGILLYSADILAFYAVVALAALGFRQVSARALLVASATAVLGGVIVLAAYGATHPASPVPGPPDWAARVVDVDASDAPDRDFIEAFAVRILGPMAVSRADLYRFLAEEQRTFALGTWRKMTCHRVITYLLFGMPSKLLLLGLPVLGCVFFGMYLARVGWVGGMTRARPYGRVCVLGSVAGMGLQIGSFFAAPAPARAPGLLIVFWLCALGGGLLLGVAYAAGMAWWCQGRERTPAVVGLVAVGRTALTNYLAQSVILGLIFYNTGLGWFGTVGAGPVVLLAFPIMVIQITVSVLWLRAFRLGPIEWVWRCTTYGTSLPMRRSPSAAQRRRASGAGLERGSFSV